MEGIITEVTRQTGIILGEKSKRQIKLAILKHIEKVGRKYIEEREAEVFLSGETKENKGYWTGLAEGAKELMRRLNDA